MTRFSYLLLIITLISIGCSEDELTPSENLIGNWELVSIERMDTIFYNSRYKDGYIAIQMNYDKNPLTISYDTLGNFRWHIDLPFTFVSSHTEYVYNLTYQWKIYSDGTFEITEEYRDLNNSIVQSQQFSNTWERQEKGVDNYEFLFQLGDPFTNPYPSLILQLANILVLKDDDVDKNSFTIYESWNHPLESNSIFIYRFERL